METPKKLKNVKMGNGTLHTVYGFDNVKKLLKLAFKINFCIFLSLLILSIPTEGYIPENVF